MIATLLLAAALAGGAPADTTAAPPAPRWFRAIAHAGPTLVSHDGDRATALGIGTGFQMGTNRWFRFTGRWEEHVTRTARVTEQTTVMLFGVQLRLRPRGWVAWPYGFVGSGYGTAPNYSDFVLPAGAEVGGGVQFLLPGGQEVFVEAGVLGANERTYVPIRIGTLIP